jgi:hypothetical protein
MSSSQNVALATYCCDCASGVGAIRIEPWMGQQLIFLRFPFLASEQDIRTMLTKLTKSMTEHMVRLGNRPWLGQLSFVFASEELSQYFAELLPIVFPHCIGFYDDLPLETEHGCRGRRIVVSNSHCIAAIYNKVLKCFCDRLEREDQCDSCEACLNQIDTWMQTRVSQPPPLADPWMPFETS